MKKAKSLLKNITGKLQQVSFVRLSIKDQVLFAKRLSFLTRAGVPILESLTMIREQTRSRGQAMILDAVLLSVSNGQSLAQSFGKFKRVFGDFAINIISVGESSGSLSENLHYLSEELKKKQILRRKVVGALVYPIFITITTIGITALLTVYIFPKIMPIFVGLNIDLPLSTKILIFVSVFLREWGLLLILLLIVLFIAFFITISRSPKFHLVVDYMVLRLPIFGKMVQNYNFANFSRTLGLLLKSGITLSEALPITANTIPNQIYNREIHKLSKSVSRGEKISSHLKKHRKFFPEILTQIISVGERSGNLSETLVYVSELYEGEVEESTKNLSSLIEPVLMVAMGIVVGFVVISVITPIYGITQHLSPR